MRFTLALIAASTMLTACGGSTGPRTAGSTAPPATSGGGGGNAQQPHSFAAPTEPTTYQGIGGALTYTYTDLIAVEFDDGNPSNELGPYDLQGDANGPTAEVYAGEASTARNSTIQITYDPRAAVYTLSINDQQSNTSIGTRFQDPSARTDFGGAEEPQWGVPNLQIQNVTYFESGDGDPISPVGGSGEGSVQEDRNDVSPLGLPESSIQLASFFLQNPGTVTQYAALAGFVRNAFSYDIDEQTGLYTVVSDTSRGAFAFGERTPNSDVPTSGVFGLSGSMIASMVNNPTLDGEAGPIFESYFQWIEGTVSMTVDFGADEVRDIEFAGTVTDPQIPALTQVSESFDPTAVQAYLPAGTAFEASGAATINLVNAGGFLGEIDTARFVAAAGATFADGSTQQDILVDGTSIDGAFFGPNAEETGGGFRVVGGVPDQRVDILGAFTAAPN